MVCFTYGGKWVEALVVNDRQEFLTAPIGLWSVNEVQQNLELRVIKSTPLLKAIVNTPTVPTGKPLNLPQEDS